jgi:hypothetical protein
MPLIIPANTLASGGYEVANSCRFNTGSSDSLSKTFGSDSNKKTFTFSCWFKRATESSSALFGSEDATGYLWFLVGVTQLYLQNNPSSTVEFRPTQYTRDFSAWYHVVLAIDTTQGTASNRVKLYLNGEQITSFVVGKETYPSLNQDLNIATGSYPLTIGEFGGQKFSGYMSEVVWIDGTALDATSFGEFDEDSGIWKPIDVSGLTFGTNGFYLDFENSGSLGADVSGNGNNFTVNNLTSIDQSTDTCTNNFATLNPIAFEGANFGGQLTEGNTQVGGAVSGSNNLAMANFAVDTGKWYWEAKASASIDNYAYIGIRTYDSAPAKNQYVGESNRWYCFKK